MSFVLQARAVIDDVASHDASAIQADASMAAAVEPDVAVADPS